MRQADFKATSVLQESGFMSNISQMPIILIPIHFDRDPTMHLPSCQRSVVIRTFITNDFMTGVPAEPGKQLPVEVSFLCCISFPCAACKMDLLTFQGLGV